MGSARGNRALGKILQSVGKNDEAEKLGCEAITQLEKLATTFPLVPAFRLELASGRSDLACVYRRTGRLDEAEQLQRAALAVLEKLAADFPESPYYRRLRREARTALRLENDGPCQGLADVNRIRVVP